MSFFLSFILSVIPLKFSPALYNSVRRALARRNVSFHNFYFVPETLVMECLPNIYGPIYFMCPWALKNAENSRPFKHEISMENVQKTTPISIHMNLSIRVTLIVHNILASLWDQNHVRNRTSAHLKGKNILGLIYFS